jgi:WD40 repeat protein
LAAAKDHKSIVFSDLVLRGPHPARPPVRIPDMVTDLVFSPADGTLAVVDMDGGLYFIKPGADRPIRINSEDENQLIEYSDWCRYLAFSADGHTLATCGGRSILLWDVEARQLRRTIKAGRAIVRQLAFHPDGKLLASGGDTPVVALWDTATGKEVNRFHWGIGSKILSLAFAPDGMTAAAGGSNRKYVVWDLDSD